MEDEKDVCRTRVIQKMKRTGNNKNLFPKNLRKKEKRLTLLEEF